jgi:hypothetical protein
MFQGVPQIRLRRNRPLHLLKFFERDFHPSETFMGQETA